MATDWQDLDVFFNCPASVEDADLRAGYESLYSRVRREVAEVSGSISTAQLVRASIMIGWTVKHAQTSRRPFSEAGGYVHPGQEKDAIMSLEAVLKDWDDIMHKARMRPAQEPGVPPDMVKEIIVTVLRDVEPSELRDKLMGKMASAFEQVGI